MTSNPTDINSAPSAKDTIFQALRQTGYVTEHNDANKKVAKQKTDIIEQQANALLNDSKYTRDLLLADDLHEAFINRINTGRVIGTSCEIIASWQDIPSAVRRTLTHKGLPQQLALQKTDRLTQLNWGPTTTDIDVTEDGSVSVCIAEYAIAETGSVVIHSGNDMPVLLNFLCQHQIIIVERKRILPYLEDYGLIANTAAINGTTPRNMCMITGCSGTTDIEGVLVRGAHGPESVHIIVVDS